MAWNPDDPMERRKRIAWSVATLSCVKTKKDPVKIYEKVLADWDEIDKNASYSLSESQETT